MACMALRYRIQPYHDGYDIGDCSMGSGEINMNEDSQSIGFILNNEDMPPKIESRLRDIVYLEDFGVSLKGSNDNYEAIIKVLNYAKEHKLFIKLPGDGNYLRVWK